MIGPTSTTGSWTYDVRVTIYNSNGYGTGDPWPSGYNNWPTHHIPGPTLREWARIFSNRLTDSLRLEHRWPCAVAVPPGPPPVPLELAAEEPNERPVRSHTWRPSTVRMRLHARQSVPARSRHKLRVWELGE